MHHASVKKKKEETDRKIQAFKNIKNKLEFREAKKEFNEKIKNGVTISFNDGNTKFNKALPSNNEIIDNINEHIYNKAVKFDEAINKSKIITDFNIPKSRQLVLIKHTLCGSTQNLANVSNKADFYKCIESYILSKS